MIYEPLSPFFLCLDPSPRKRPNGISVRPMDSLDLSLCGLSQNVNFRPNCTARLPPDPITGFAAATSGVAQPQPNGCTDGSFKPNPFCPPYGLAKFGWFKMLKNSARNWAWTRSPRCQFLATERSKFLKPESGNMLRDMFPNCPSGGGIIIELPLA